ncbi:capsular biosynthesis protein, partial [Pseudanabaenaceae cyanobacterium LEGE 13415]|nr:capsular biosynthesis protein [Pseudanabaenaceae cyanobacterium LEGE 13415]
VSVTRSPKKIQTLNVWIEQYCAENDCIYLDYYSQMVDDRGFLQAHLSTDGLHPNDAGYRIMAPLANAAIQKIT